jgi:hypothetical protein
MRLEENRQSHDGGRREDTCVRKDRDRPRQSKDQKSKRNLIGKKSHHDGIIIEKRNDPRETRESRKVDTRRSYGD